MSAPACIQCGHQQLTEADISERDDRLHVCPSCLHTQLREMGGPTVNEQKITLTGRGQVLHRFSAEPGATVGLEFPGGRVTVVVSPDGRGFWAHVSIKGGEPGDDRGRVEDVRVDKLGAVGRIETLEREIQAQAGHVALLIVPEPKS